MSARTHYETLGVARTAATEEIKKRFRELARRYHPDVASTADAAGRFREINEAYRVLCDPARRALYDAELKLAQSRQRPPGPPRAAQATPPRPGPAASHPQGTRSGPGTKPSPAAVRDGVLDEARACLRRLKLRDAEALCRHAIRTFGRHSAAYEILGDIARARGRADDALAHYSLAIQLDRANRSAQEKFDRLVGQPSGPTLSGRAAAARRAARPAPSSGRTAPSGDRARALGTAVGLAALALLIGRAAWADNPPATGVNVLEWDVLLLASLAAGGLIAGFVLAVNGTLGPLSRELAARPNPRGTPAVSLGLVLLSFSLLCFYAAAALYGGIALARGGASRSVLLALTATVVVVLLFAAASQPSTGFVLLMGGNVAFPGVAAGWRLADALRREGRAAPRGGW